MIDPDLEMMNRNQLKIEVMRLRNEFDQVKKYIPDNSLAGAKLRGYNPNHDVDITQETEHLIIEKGIITEIKVSDEAKVSEQD